jgi:hypothetical protein
VSHGLLPTELSVTKEEYSHKLSLTDMTITPGVNRLTLKMKVIYQSCFFLAISTNLMFFVRPIMKALMLLANF